MLKSPISPSQFNGRRHVYTAFIYSVKEPKFDALLDWIQRTYADKVDFVVEPKYDGLYVQVTKEGSKVHIYTDQGKDIASRVKPDVLRAVKEIPHDFVAEGELESYVDGKHQPRGITIGYIHQLHPRYPASLTMTLTLFDLLYLDGKQVAKEDTLTRLSLLKQFGLPSSTTPRSPLNRVPYEHVTSIKQLVQAAKKFMRVRHFEGVIIKPTNQTAYNLKFIKFKKYIEYSLAVLRRIETKKKGVFNYDLGAFQGGKLVEVARSLNSSIRLTEGDHAAVACFNVSVYVDSSGKFHRCRLYSTRIQAKTDAPINTVDQIIRTASYYNVLEVHHIKK